MLIALDTETGGLNPNTNPLLAFTLWSPTAEFSKRVRGNREACHPRALEINGLNPEDGEDPIDVEDALFDWWTQLGKPKFQLIGHNVGSFDVPFMRQLDNVDDMFDYHYRDSAVLATALADVGLLQKKVNLKNVASQLKIKYAPHSSRQDAMASWHCWHRMIDILNGRTFEELDLENS